MISIWPESCLESQHLLRLSTKRCDFTAFIHWEITSHPFSLLASRSFLTSPFGYMPLIKVVFHSWLMFSNPLCNASVVIKYKNFYGKPNFRQLLKTTFTAFQFHSGAATCLVCLQSKNQIICGRANGGSREGAQGARVPPLILGKKEGMTEGRKASMPSKSKMPPPLPP